MRDDDSVKGLAMSIHALREEGDGSRYREQVRAL